MKELTIVDIRNNAPEVMDRYTVPGTLVLNNCMGGLDDNYKLVIGPTGRGVCFSAPKRNDYNPFDNSAINKAKQFWKQWVKQTKEEQEEYLWPSLGNPRPLEYTLTEAIR